MRAASSFRHKPSIRDVVGLLRNQLFLKNSDKHRYQYVNELACFNHPLAVEFSRE